jgi:hypothetical protein
MFRLCELQAIIGEILIFFSREFLKVLAPSLISNLFTSAKRQIEATPEMLNFVMKLIPFKIACAFVVGFVV